MAAVAVAFGKSRRSVVLGLRGSGMAGGAATDGNGSRVAGSAGRRCEPRHDRVVMKSSVAAVVAGPVALGATGADRSRRECRMTAVA